MKKLTTLLSALLIGWAASAQSTVAYTLRLLSTTPIQLLDTMPETLQSDRVDVHISGYTLLAEADSVEMADFLVAPVGETGAWTAAFDSLTSFVVPEGTFVLWQNNVEIKNKQKRVLRANAYGAMQAYVVSNTAVKSRLPLILSMCCGGALLLLLGTYVFVTIFRRRGEKKLSSVQQEMLRRRRADTQRHIWSQVYLWLLLLVLYAPIVLILIFSFTESKILGNWTGFSFQLYANLFSGHAGGGLNDAIIYTVIVALVAAFSSTILGTLAAIGIFNMRARQRKLVTFLNSVPMINPDIITGISLFLLFVALGVTQGLTTVCIAHVVFCTPYVVLSVLPRLSKMNPNTYEAALDLGATPFQALWKVMMPELWPGMLSGFVLALTLSVDDFGVTFFTKGSGGLETLSTFIYSDARKGGLTPELRPLFSIILLVTLSVLVFINLKAARQQKK